MKNQKGITLVALIITIIVMLILVAVTINLALNGGLFTRAKNATVQTQKEVEREQLINCMTGGYNDSGIFVVESVENKLPEGAKWCRESDETYSNTPDNITLSEDGNWVITENNNKFFIDKYGRVLDKKTSTQAEKDKEELISIIARNLESENVSAETIINELEDNGWTVTAGTSYYTCRSSNGTQLYVIGNGNVVDELPESVWWYGKGLTSKNVKYNKSYKGDNNDEIIISSDGGFTKYTIQGDNRYDDLCLENLESELAQQFWGFAVSAEQNVFFWIDMSCLKFHMLRFTEDDKIVYFTFVSDDDDDSNEESPFDEENMSMVQMVELYIEYKNIEPIEIYELQN